MIFGLAQWRGQADDDFWEEQILKTLHQVTRATFVRDGCESNKMNDYWSDRLPSHPGHFENIATIDREEN